LLNVSFASEVEDPLPMHVAESSQRVAKRPTFAEGNFESCDFVCCLLETLYGFVEKGGVMVWGLLVNRLGVLSLGDV